MSQKGPLSPTASGIIAHLVAALFQQALARRPKGETAPMDPQMPAAPSEGSEPYNALRDRQTPRSSLTSIIPAGTHE
jgi:hypothetical protein